MGHDKMLLKGKKQLKFYTTEPEKISELVHHQ
jgi:hypothetical protein